MEREVRNKRVGDLLWDLACQHAAYSNQTEFVTSLRNRSLSKNRFIKFISAMYPVVVGFNRALILSISKVDNVRSASLVKGLAEQLLEEQNHNDMWRAMLCSYNVDHLGLYSDFHKYMKSFSGEVLNRKTSEVITSLVKVRGNVALGVFPRPAFPEAVLALFHHMCTVASCEDYNFWCHFGSQSALEAMIYNIASNSFYPGIVDNPELDKGPHSTAWWREHARQGSYGERCSTEEKHLEIARVTLNRSGEANEHVDEVVRVAKQSLQLFSASIASHDTETNGPGARTPGWSG